MSAPEKIQFFDQFRAAVADGTFVRLNLGHPLRHDDAVRNIFVRPVQLREGLHLSFTYRHARKDVVKNLVPEEAYTLLEELIGLNFANAFLSLTTATFQLTLRKGRSARLISGRPEVEAAPNLSHDRSKERTVSVQAPWLRELGITNMDGSVRPTMEAKYRQIHRFVELLGPLLVEARLLDGERPLRVTDMGAGKGYLTFALHEHLRAVAKRPVATRGVELRAELVDQANAVARQLHCEGLEFTAGTITDLALSDSDVVIALHACDTATDDALAKGIHAGATLIVVAPCCHKEIRPQIVPPPVLLPGLRHGILLEREAEFVTDALRAALLECAGYEPRVMEFISPEHTSKNLMIVGIKQADRADTQGRTRVQDLARFYGIREQRLAHRLGISLI